MDIGWLIDSEGRIGYRIVKQERLAVRVILGQFYILVLRHLHE